MRSAPEFTPPGPGAGRSCGAAPLSVVTPESTARRHRSGRRSRSIGACSIPVTTRMPAGTGGLALPDLSPVERACRRSATTAASKRSRPFGPSPSRRAPSSAAWAYTHDRPIPRRFATSDAVSRSPASGDSAAQGPSAWRRPARTRSATRSASKATSTSAMATCPSVMPRPLVGPVLATRRRGSTDGSLRSLPRAAPPFLGQLTSWGRKRLAGQPRWHPQERRCGESGPRPPWREPRSRPPRPTGSAPRGFPRVPLWM